MQREMKQHILDNKKIQNRFSCFYCSLFILNFAYELLIPYLTFMFLQTEVYDVRLTNLLHETKIKYDNFRINTLSLNLTLLITQLDETNPKYYDKTLELVFIVNCNRLNLQFGF